MRSVFKLQKSVCLILLTLRQCKTGVSLPQWSDEKSDLGNVPATAGLGQTIVLTKGFILNFRGKEAEYRNITPKLPV